nr:SMI1/KNR4 family protein [Conchiformibius kuhniae]
MNKQDLLKIEEVLEVHLPTDFIKISEFYSGGIVGGIEHLSISLDCDENILTKTLYIRNHINLPNKYLVLSEMNESLILLDTENSHVIWIDSVDMSFERADYWNSYAEFFSYMIEEEEN